MGDLSYSWYLWHWPVILLIQQQFEGRPVAVFMVYAATPLSFDEEELTLLMSLADNFSFALEARERDAQRRSMETALRASVGTPPHEARTTSSP